MEKVIEELPVQVNSNKFWGAVQIYTEKPHIINRRLCGTVNLWVGTSDTAKCEKGLFVRLKEALSHEESRDRHYLHDKRNSLEVTNWSDSVQQIEDESVTGSKAIKNTSDECKVRLLKVLCDIMRLNGFCDVKDEISGRQKEQEEGSVETEVLDDEVVTVGETSMSCDEKNNMTIPWERLHGTKGLKVAIIRKVLPRYLNKCDPVLEVAVLDGESICASYLAESTPGVYHINPRVSYTFRHSTRGISLTVLEDEFCETSEKDSNLTWLQKNVLPKLTKWALEIQEDGVVEQRGSLKLIDIQEYNQLYQKLKTKYGHPLIEMWPEVTDPLKYVYEDIAIATYLILLWRQERNKKGLTKFQTFVDLGCGNGILVYILTEEGHQGLGIDLKKRNIWDLLPKHIQLKEGIVEPSDKNLFPEYDWLIGNHSDELTPWIPVIAAKSEFTTRFFVLPCCAFDFDCKYRRKDARVSQYSDYLQYVKNVGLVCGFEMWEDKLRIPSTKRICFVGQERTYAEGDTSQVFQKINEFIRKRRDWNSSIPLTEENKKESAEDNASGDKSTSDKIWSVDFKPRDAVQAVRNCTKLEKNVKEDIISTIVDALMKKKLLVEINLSEGDVVTWDRGGSMSLGDLAQHLQPQQLAALKKECGGLQTLLKNHRYIFSISKGVVSLQVPVPESRSKVPVDRIKTKLCWFYTNHYQGCPLPSHTCVYAHGQQDVKTIPIAPQT